MNQSLKHNRGFTLIELLITLSVGSLVLMAVLSSFTSFLRSGATSQHLNRLHTSAENIFNDLTLEIHNSTSASINSANCLYLSAGDSDQPETIKYCLVGSNFVKEILEKSYSVNLNPDNIQVDSFEIVDLSGSDPVEGLVPPLFRITLKISSRTYSSSPIEHQKTTTVSVRKNQQDEFTNPTPPPTPDTRLKCNDICENNAECNRDPSWVCHPVDSISVCRNPDNLIDLTCKDFGCNSPCIPEPNPSVLDRCETDLGTDHRCLEVSNGDYRCRLLSNPTHNKCKPHSDTHIYDYGDIDE
jgi:prepilin-type N-terminal cleavage/methylation domain-containing protein